MRSTLTFVSPKNLTSAFVLSTFVHMLPITHNVQYKNPATNAANPKDLRVHGKEF